MKLSKLLMSLALALPSLLSVAGNANAANIMCKTLANNHMLVSDATVSACVDAGLGNIGQGNPANDDFLNQFSAPTYGGYTNLGDQTWTGANTAAGTFSIDANEWNNYADLYVGFKFGTGNTADEWFVYKLQNLVSSGSWNFVDVLVPGNGTGGLSHVTLYGADDGTEPPAEAPEPGSLALVGLALLGVGAARKRLG
jgi:hypothetical protein